MFISIERQKSLDSSAPNLIRAFVRTCLPWSVENDADMWVLIPSTEVWESEFFVFVFCFLFFVFCFLFFVFCFLFFVFCFCFCFCFCFGFVFLLIDNHNRSEILNERSKWN